MYPFSSSEEILVKNVGPVTSLAVDWLACTVYWIDSEKVSRNENSGCNVTNLVPIFTLTDLVLINIFYVQKAIELVEANGTVRRTLRTGADEPGVIALHPQRRYIDLNI